MLARAVPHFLLVFIIYKVSCQGTSLTFVIDDTGSMYNDIYQVRNEVDSIMDIVLDKQASQISNIVLVTFNDPQKPRLRVRTSNRNELKWALATLPVDGGGDCPELALSGIKLALESSLSGSYIYVFTDASAKDYYMSEEIQQLCQRKQSQIVFVLTGDCDNPHSPEFQVYYKLSTASSGLVIKVPKDKVQTVVDAFLKEDIKGNKTGLTTQLTPAYVETKVPFWIDDLTNYAIVSASGTDVHLSVRQELYMQQEPVIWTEHAKVIKVICTKPGKYEASVKSNSPTSVVITGRSDFYFRHGFSEQRPKSPDDTAPQPFSDTLTHLSFLVTNPGDAVRIQTAQILDMKENVIKEMPLHESWPNFYTTEPFVAPSHMFKVALTGKVVKTGNPLRRIARIPVTPQKLPPGILPKSPVVVIEEGASVEVARGAALTLTCKVSAYPPPEITWRNERGLRMKSTQSRVQVPYDYISYLEIPSASEAIYYCHARNSLDSKQYKAIDVIIKDPFIINAVPTGVTKIAYGTESTLNCDVRSQQPLQIRWYHVNRNTGETELVTSSKKYSTSKDGTKLKILYMDVDLVGKYTCKVFLMRDPTRKRDFNTTVEITGILPPKIDSNLQIVKVKEHMPATIKCQILEGMPKPNISWQMKAVGSTEYRSIAGSGSELHVERAALADGGLYKCVAQNVAGRREQVVAELMVLKAPAVAIVEGSSMEVPYGSQLTLACRVTANPKPTVIWKDSKGNTLPATSSVARSGFEYSTIARVLAKRSGQYSCSAVNDQGSATESTQVSVSSPFRVHSKPLDSISVKYGDEITLKCHITSSLPMEIRWYRIKESTSVNNEIVSSDQYTILSNGAELKINAMDVGLDGEYACRASLIQDPDEHVEYKTHVQIYGLEVPEITGVSVQKVTAGAAVSIKCNVRKGVPHPVLSWQYKAKTSGKFVDIGIHSDEWHTANVRGEHSGYYKCTATNNQGTDEHVTQLIVQVPPRIITEESIFEGITTDIALKVPCDTIGFPTPDVKWNVDGRSIVPDNKYAIEDGALIIKNPKLNDSNEMYACTATNMVGSDTKLYQVIVTDVLYDYGVSHDIYILVNESTTLNCSLPRISSSSVKWFKNGYDLHIEGPYMSIQHALVTNDGNYTCRVSDVHGSASETFVVDVGYPPKFKVAQENPAVTYWSDQMEEYLRCDVRAKPMPDIEWTFNGKPWAGVSSQAPKISKLGHYKCNVSNVHGAVQQEFDVKPLN